MKIIKNQSLKIELYGQTSKDRRFVLIFPQAMGSSRQLMDLINLLIPQYSVGVITEGYYGIKIKEKYRQDLDSTSQRIFETISNITKSKLVFFSSSVGSIYAIKTSEKIKPSVFIMAAPAIYHHKKIRTFFFEIAIRIIIIAQSILVKPTVFFSDFLNMEYFSELLNSIIKDASMDSYLRCLDEIINFSRNNSKLIQETIKNSIVVLGKYDIFFEKLCDINISKYAKQTIEIDSDHDSLVYKNSNFFNNLIYKSLYLSSRK